MVTDECMEDFRRASQVAVCKINLFLRVDQGCNLFYELSNKEEDTYEDDDPLADESET